MTSRGPASTSSPESADDGLARVYIGEADVLGTRINQHYSGPSAKEFWTRAVAFTSKDENLNKAHVRYLESRLVGLAQAAKLAKVENSTVPAAPALSESDRAEAETFLEEMLLVYPLLGIGAFTPPHQAVDDARPLLHLKGRGIAARGRDTATGFVVYADSTAAASETDSLHHYVRTQRKSLLGTRACSWMWAGLTGWQRTTPSTRPRPPPP